MTRLNEQLEIVGVGAAATTMCKCGHALGPATDLFAIYIVAITSSP